MGKFSPDLYRLELAAAVSIGIWGDFFFSFEGGDDLYSLCAVLTLNIADYTAHVRSS